MQKTTIRTRWRCARVALPAAAALLGGCATAPDTPIPDAIRNAPAGNLQLVEARQDPQRHVGAPVRWGGTVVEVRRDDAGNAEVEVLERRLDDAGRPQPGAPSDGRFVIRAAAEVDPALYRTGSDVTVAGRVERTVEGRVGDRDVAMPVVAVEEYVRWEPDWRRYPYAYDPWYEPWPGPRVHFGIGVGHYHGLGYGHPYYW